MGQIGFIFTSTVSASIRKISVICILLPLLSFSQHSNRYRHHQKQGKWISYHDSALIDNISYWRKGKPKGKWKFYDPEGHLIKTEKYRFRKISNIYYHPNGKVYKKGMSKQVLEDKYLHFYYYGEWLVYDSTGVLAAKQIFDKGTKISEERYDSKGSVNDSLVKVLRLIESDIFKYRDSISIAEREFGKGSKQYQRVLGLNNLHSSMYLSKLDSLILRYGYPGKTLTGNDYGIAFSLISAANLAYKEKYLGLITAAADKGELDWSDVAFFVDKVKVAKKEKQVYCTQYKFDEGSRKILYYPTEDIDKLNERRKKVGIGEMKTTDLNFLEY